MQSSGTVKTRVFVISDTHDGFQNRDEEPYSSDGAFRPVFPKSDVLIHSGDLTMVGTMEQYRSTLAMLSTIDAELKLVIAGNHDLSLQEDYYMKDNHARSIAGPYYDELCADQAARLWTGQEAKDAGVTYLTEGMYTFQLSNGAEFTVYASPWQPVFFDWAFNYPKNEDRWNPPHLVDPSDPNTPNAVPAPLHREPHPIPEGTKVDFMITHGPPWQHLDRCYNGYKAGCPHLLKALERVRPRLHCFGHIHEAWGAEVIRWKGEGEPAGPGKVRESTEVLGSLDLDSEISQHPANSEVVERRAAFADVSSSGPRPLQAGKETLLVNSCIMTLQYKAQGAGWLVDIDLPVKGVDPRAKKN